MGEKTFLLSEHSEKLALAFGILTFSPGTPIQIARNLRVCGDYHSAISFISIIVHHEIILNFLVGSIASRRVHVLVAAIGEDSVPNIWKSYVLH